MRDCVMYEDFWSTLLLAGCRAATTDYAKHALSTDCTLTFNLISRDNSILRTKDCVYSHSQSNSVYAIMSTRYCVPEILPVTYKVGSTMRNSYHSYRSDDQKNLQFFLAILLFVRLSPATNLPTIFILIYFCITFCICSSTISLASSKNCRSSICLEFIIAPVNIRLSKTVSISCLLSCIQHSYVGNVRVPNLSHFRVAQYVRLIDCLTLIIASV